MTGSKRDRGRKPTTTTVHKLVGMDSTGTSFRSTSPRCRIVIVVDFISPIQVTFAL